MVTIASDKLNRRAQMPSVSLIVCLHDQRDLLKRLLRESEACYDELIVVHDGVANCKQDDTEKLVAEHGGRFFIRPRAHQQEPHWPFAWGQARHNWILRLDADEFPSEAMKEWLRRFREGAELGEEISGYTCIWPLWNGKKQVTEKWPAGRIFLFNKNHVRFFGLNEQIPIPDGRYESLDLTLHHQPSRKSVGIRNVLFRKQAYHWRRQIAESLMKRPTDLPCWRWDSPVWPARWEEIRTRPVRTLFYRLLIEMLRTMRDQWRVERRIFPSAAINGSVHHALICLEYSADPSPARERAQEKENGGQIRMRENLPRLLIATKFPPNAPGGGQLLYAKWLMTGR